MAADKGFACSYLAFEQLLNEKHRREELHNVVSLLN
jgi:hypothetical protein